MHVAPNHTHPNPILSYPKPCERLQVAGLTGGPGILPGVNVGDECAVFEQGRAPRRQGHRRARPLPTPPPRCWPARC